MTIKLCLKWQQLLNEKCREDYDALGVSLGGVTNFLVNAMKLWHF